jgi:hypothetical protein
MLIRFWFQFEDTPEMFSLALTLGCGVTAYSYEDALHILKSTVFKHQPPGNIIQVIENIDVSTLDANHILSNSLPASVRGVWYPMGYWYNE